MTAVLVTLNTFATATVKSFLMRFMRFFFSWSVMEPVVSLQLMMESIKMKYSWDKSKYLGRKQMVCAFVLGSLELEPTL